MTPYFSSAAALLSARHLHATRDQGIVGLDLVHCLVNERNWAGAVKRRVALKNLPLIGPSGTDGAS